MLTTLRLRLQSGMFSPMKKLLLETFQKRRLKKEDRRTIERLLKLPDLPQDKTRVRRRPTLERKTRMIQVLVCSVKEN